MLKYIIAGALLVVFWVVALWLQLPLWLPGVLTLIVLLTLGALWLVQRIRAQRAAKGLEQALVSQSADDVGGLRPDVAAEIEEMTAEFQRAVLALKQSKLGGGGGAALYALPWYLIMGPPGAGKSTALRNSGLQFPYLSSSHRSGAVKGIGGTRNCDWWLTNEAVILDTAGRFTTQEDQDEWLAFLDLAQRHRARQPLNGIIVAVAIDEIANASDEERSALARRIRERVDEVTTRLRIAVPVYLFFTKADLVAGFTETFGDLSGSERGQPWGFTFPFTRPPEDLSSAFSEQFDALVHALRGRVLRRMSDERTVARRTAIFEFPEQFRALRTPLSEFTRELFEDNVFQQAPILRGAYFTSGTQEGRPIDRLMQSLADSLGVPEALADQSPVVEGKSYFLCDVFRRIVFADAHVAGPTESHARRRRLVRFASAAALLLLATGIATVSAYTWSASRAFVDSTVRRATELASVPPLSEGVEKVAVFLMPVHNRIEEIRRYAEDGPPWAMGLGMYQGDELYPEVSRSYQGRVGQVIIGPSVRRTADDLRRWSVRYENDIDAQPSAKEHQRYFETLKVHLLLTGPKDEQEPALDPRMRGWLASKVAARYAADEGIAEPPRDVAEHVDLYLRLLNDGEKKFAKRDVRAVQRARNVLVRVSDTHVALAQLVRELSTKGYNLSLGRLIGTTASALRSQARVRGAFTRQAWEDVVRERLSSLAGAQGEDAWVIEGGVSEQAEEVASKRELALLRSAYFRAYINEWRGFVRDLSVDSAGDEVKSLTVLQDLTRGDKPPLPRLFERLQLQLDLPDEDTKSAAEEVADGVIGTIKRHVQGGEEQGGEEPAGEKPARPKAKAAKRGTRPTGPRGEQLLVAADVAQAFQGFMSFGVAPEPEKGAEAAPVGLDVYQEQLATVRDALQAYRDNPEAVGELKARLLEVRTRVRGLLDEQESRWRARLQSLLWPPIASASESCRRALALSVERAWCPAVREPYEQSLAGQYPFDRRGSDLALADFTTFYQPGQGTLWKFYSETLKSELPRQGAQQGNQAARGLNAAFRPALMQFLRRSQALTQAFFAPGAAEPNVAFDVRIRPNPGAASTTLAVGGREVEYHNGPERWTRLAWPGEAPAQGASLRVRGAGGMQERLREDGEWGLFRLLERAAKVTPAGRSRSFVATWRLGGHAPSITVDFRPIRNVSPFFGAARGGRRGRLFGALRGDGVAAPRAIAAASSGCATGLRGGDMGIGEPSANLGAEDPGAWP